MKEINSGTPWPRRQTQSEPCKPRELFTQPISITCQQTLIFSHAAVTWHTYRGWEIHTQLQLEKLDRRDHLENLSVDEVIILKRMLNKLDIKMWTVFFSDP